MPLPGLWHRGIRSAFRRQHGTSGPAPLAIPGSPAPPRASGSLCRRRPSATSSPTPSPPACRQHHVLTARQSSSLSRPEGSDAVTAHVPSATPPSSRATMCSCLFHTVPPVDFPPFPADCPLERTCHVQEASSTLFVRVSAAFWARNAAAPSMSAADATAAISVRTAGADPFRSRSGEG